LKKALKITGIVFGSLLVIIILVAAGLQIYFHLHKKELIVKAGAEISRKIKAKVAIRDAEITWLSSFPSISIALDNITIRDSSNSGNSDPFLVAARLYVHGNIIKLIRGNIHLDDISIEDGDLRLHRDAEGKCNLHILDEKPKEQKPSRESLFDFLTLKNIKISISDISKQQDISVLIHSLKCNSRFSDTGTRYNIDMQMHINFLGFNTREGTYGRNKEAEGSFAVFMNSQNKTLSFNKITLFINKEALKADGIFHLDTSQLFRLKISAENFSYENGITSLLDTTQKTLKQVSLKKPVQFEAELHGDTKYLSIPHVLLTWKINDDEISTPYGIISHASLAGTFINDVIPWKLRKDDNSRLTLTGFDGQWHGSSPMHCNEMVLTDLIHPSVRFDLKAQFQLPDIDSLIQSESVSLEEGIAAVDIAYSGPLDYVEGVVPEISGTIELKKSVLLYIPRNLKLTNCTALLKFNKTEVTIEKVFSRLGKSDISINGHIKSFAPIFTNNGNDLLLQWKIRSQSINLSELVPLLGPRNQVRRNKNKGALRGISHAIDLFADKCNIKAEFEIKKFVFNHFEAKDAYARMTLNNNTGWAIQSLKLKHAGGLISASGSLAPDAKSGHSVVLKARITNANISRVFYSFNNFGISSLDSSKIKGTLSLTTKFTANLDNKANLLTKTIKGNLDFNIVKGELINFTPIQAICEKIFPNRNFTDINFDTLKNQVTFTDYLIKMDRMEISSNILHLYAQGTYDIDNKATDFEIQIPTSNILKPDLSQFPENKGTDTNEGLSVYVRATNTSEGKLTYKYSLVSKTVNPGK
jgi:hypothetical protein